MEELTEQDTKQIRAYWKGQLSSEERLVLEQRMKENDDFRRDVEAYRYLMFAIKERGDQQVAKYVAEVRAQVEREEERTVHPPKAVLRKEVFKRPFIWAAAAAFALCLWWAYSAMVEYRFQQTLNSAFAAPLKWTTPSRIPGEAQGFGSDTARLRDSLVRVAVGYAEKGAVGELLKVANAYETAFPQSPSALLSLLKAIALVAQGNREDALPILERCSQSPEPQVSQAAGWYQALTLAYEPATREKARAQLEKIRQNPAHAFQNQAEALLKSW